jgi:hypothetical protein
MEEMRVSCTCGHCGGRLYRNANGRCVLWLMHGISDEFVCTALYAGAPMDSAGTQIVALRGMGVHNELSMCVATDVFVQAFRTRGL